VAAATRWAAAAAGGHGDGTNSTVKAWGFGATAKLGDSAVGTAIHPVAVHGLTRSDRSRSTPRAPATGLTGVTQIATSGSQTLALVKGGNPCTWGYELDGENGHRQEARDLLSRAAVRVACRQHNAEIQVSGNGQAAATATASASA
jgi:hypothetical protein